MPQTNVQYLPGEIPAAHREVFTTIDEQVSWVHAVWKIYRQLYAEKDNVDLLNQVAPACASVIQDALLDDVMLSLTRLTDPATSGRDRKTGLDRENLVLSRLKELAVASGQWQLVSEVEAALASVKAACAALRDHRDKRLAHSDLQVALATMPLPLPSRKAIEDALAMVREVMNALNMHFRGGPTIYDEVSMRGDGESLISCLQDALRFRKLRRQHRDMTEAEVRFALDARGLKGENLLGNGD